MPALQKEMQASSTSNFRYFTCLLDKGHIRFHGFFDGGPGGIRTLDLSDANRTLSQLSYKPGYEVAEP